MLLKTSLNNRKKTSKIKASEEISGAFFSALKLKKMARGGSMGAEIPILGAERSHKNTPISSFFKLFIGVFFTTL